MIDDNEPSMNKIDDFHKPMPKEKKGLLSKILLYITAGIVTYLIIATLSGQFT